MGYSPACADRPPKHYLCGVRACECRCHKWNQPAPEAGAVTGGVAQRLGHLLVKEGSAGSSPVVTARGQQRNENQIRHAPHYSSPVTV